MTPPRVYYAVEGRGAFVRPLCPPDIPSASPGRPALSIVTPTRLEALPFYESDQHLRILAHTPSFGADTIKAFLSSYKNPEVISSPGFSLLALMDIAEGKGHIMPRLASTCEWNTCAAHAIINEAGGEILQVAGGAMAATGAQLEYAKPHPLNPHFVAYGKRLVLSPSASPTAGMRNLFAAIPHTHTDSTMFGEGEGGCAGGSDVANAGGESHGGPSTGRSLPSPPMFLSPLPRKRRDNFSRSASGALSVPRNTPSHGVAGGVDIGVTYEQLITQLEMMGAAVTATSPQGKNGTSSRVLSRTPSGATAVGVKSEEGGGGGGGVSLSWNDPDEYTGDSVDVISDGSESDPEGDEEGGGGYKDQEEVLRSSMMFSFLSVVFVALVGWVLLVPPDID